MSEKKHGLFGVLVPPNSLVAGPFHTKGEAVNELEKLERRDSRTDATPVRYELVVINHVD